MCSALRAHTRESRLAQGLAEELGLLHTSHGVGHERFIRIEKKAEGEATEEVA